MGAKLSHYYEEAKAIGGLKGRMRLAVITKVSSDRCGELPDSPENIKLFEDAIQELKKEFK